MVGGGGASRRGGGGAQRRWPRRCGGWRRSSVNGRRGGGAAVALAAQILLLSGKTDESAACVWARPDAGTPARLSSLLPFWSAACPPSTAPPIPQTRQWQPRRPPGGRVAPWAGRLAGPSSSSSSHHPRVGRRVQRQELEGARVAEAMLVEKLWRAWHPTSFGGGGGGRETHYRTRGGVDGAWAVPCSIRGRQVEPNGRRGPRVSTVTWTRLSTP